MAVVNKMGFGYMVALMVGSCLPSGGAMDLNLRSDGVGGARQVGKCSEHSSRLTMCHKTHLVRKIERRDL